MLNKTGYHQIQCSPAVTHLVNAEKDGEPKRNPEVKDKSGKNFPHQTAEDRTKHMASSTESEAGVKTREYTPKEGTNVYDDEEKK